MLPDNTPRKYSPDGYCECGCGLRRPYSRKPKRFIHGHRASLPRKVDHYRSKDRGYETPCWIWQLGLLDSGYGHLRVNGVRFRAHCYYYRKLKGPIPEGLVLDHLCEVKDCVNPKHLEAVTQAENLRRSRKSRDDG